MSATRCCTHHHPRRLLYLLIGHCFVACYGVVPRMEAKSRNADGEDGIGRRGVTVVCGFSGVAPGSALHCSVELVEVLQLEYLLLREAFILQDLLFVCLEHLSHVVAHGFA